MEYQDELFKVFRQVLCVLLIYDKRELSRNTIKDLFTKFIIATLAKNVYIM